MGFLLGVVISLHVFVSVSLIILVLLQQGKGADAGAAFGAGAGASGTLFGAAGSGSFLSRLTSIAVTIFFLTSLTLSYLVSHQKPESHNSVIDKLPSVSAEFARNSAASSQSGLIGTNGSSSEKKKKE